MKRNSDRALATTLGLFVLLFWLGFLVHASPRFPGTFAGSMLGIAGAALIILPSFLYASAKRSARLKSVLPIKRLLQWHIYSSFLGAVLVLAHSAHKFDSLLGMALTATTLLAVLTGYIGRFFLGYVSAELREKQATLAQLRRAGELSAESSSVAPILAQSPGELAAAVVELEYSVAGHEMLKGRAGTWLRVHFVIAIVFMVLLSLHVAAGIYFGLRWW